MDENFELRQWEITCLGILVAPVKVVSDSWNFTQKDLWNELSN